MDDIQSHTHLVQETGKETTATLEYQTEKIIVRTLHDNIQQTTFIDVEWVLQRALIDGLIDGYRCKNQVDNLPPGEPRQQWHEEFELIN